MTAPISSEAGSLPIIFFIPGAWHGPWVFDDVRSILSARGFGTEASSLTTVGSIDPRIGVLSDAAKIRSALIKIIDSGRELVLIAHSYGGLVVSNAVDGLGLRQRISKGLNGGVITILYLAAFAIPSKTSLLAAVGGSYLPWWGVSGDGFVTPTNPADVFYADVETSLAEKAIASLKPVPIQIVKDISTFDPWNNGFEVGYIFAEEDQALHISDQRGMFAQFPAGSFSASLSSSHSPFFSMPGALADTIEAATKHALAKRLSK
ncbi:hypothetical protein GQX73_g6790 [Xylaria multiplex]|uniref:AB hydrolase-1 domain-containing protein n=1 Tax=Xylaria multiplex TaxID=323545 RepID=A0A7C8ILN2_9PEZI|nr:hypothetical protein GQX73_g6790 [Xylaria multiplex]